MRSVLVVFGVQSGDTKLAKTVLSERRFHSSVSYRLPTPEGSEPEADPIEEHMGWSEMYD